MRIYLDYNASTPIAPDVAAAMASLLTSHYGNPSSHHWAGEPAKRALEDARSDVAALLGATPDEIVFTSGGSEANNHAITGVFFAARRLMKSPHIITTSIEHPAVLEPARFIERLGARVTRLPVDGTGLVDPDEVRRALTPATVLISVMHANNEVGTIEPIEAIGHIARDQGILFHTDAAQSMGKISTLVHELHVDLLSVAGHKLYAPKGVGCLFIRQGVALEPLVHGAGHERGRRAGTESALLATGLGAACRLARTDPCEHRLRSLRDTLWERLQAAFGERIVLNGHESRRLPNTLNVSFMGRMGAEILSRLDGVAASTGSACHSGSYEMSPVLCAMGKPPEVGLGAIRFSLGRLTTEDEIDVVIGRLCEVI